LNERGAGRLLEQIVVDGNLLTSKS